MMSATKSVGKSDIASKALRNIWDILKVNVFICVTRKEWSSSASHRLFCFCSHDILAEMCSIFACEDTTNSLQFSLRGRSKQRCMRAVFVVVAQPVDNFHTLDLNLSLACGDEFTGVSWLKMCQSVVNHTVAWFETVIYRWPVTGVHQAPPPIRRHLKASSYFTIQKTFDKIIWFKKVALRRCFYI